MKKLFLTSIFSQVGEELSRLVPKISGLKIVFVTTAADVYETKPWMEADRQKLIDLGFEVTDYDIKRKNEITIYKDLENKDAIFVAGGNVFYLLYHARETGFDKVLIKLVAQDKIFIGSSAGSVLVGPTIEPVKSLDDPKQAPKLKSFESLSLVDFVILPHYGKEKYEQKYQDIIKEWSGKVRLMPLTDNQAVVIEGNSHYVL